MAHVKLHAVRLALRMPRWRFYDGELVPVEVTLQNVGKTPLVYEDSCPPPGSLVRLAGADTAFPAIGVLGCGALDETILAPGRTVTAEQLVILPLSAGAGKLTAYLTTPTRPDLSRLTPSLLFSIGSRAPARHRFTLAPQSGHRVSVQPSGAHRSLYYSRLFCDSGKLGSLQRGSGGWQSLPEGFLLTRPSCNADGQLWGVLAGAPPGSTPRRIVWSVLVGAQIGRAHV